MPREARRRPRSGTGPWARLSPACAGSSRLQTRPRPSSWRRRPALDPACRDEARGPSDAGAAGCGVCRQRGGLGTGGWGGASSASGGRPCGLARARARACGHRGRRTRRPASRVLRGGQRQAASLACRKVVLFRFQTNQSREKGWPPSGSVLSRARDPRSLALASGATAGARPVLRPPRPQAHVPGAQYMWCPCSGAEDTPEQTRGKPDPGAGAGCSRLPVPRAHTAAR